MMLRYARIFCVLQAGAIILMTCFFVTGAAWSASVPKTLRVGVLYWSMNIPGQVAMRKGLEGEAANLNREAERSGLPRIELLPQVAGDGVAGVERQIVQMTEMVRLKPDIIIVQPTDNAALVAPLKFANEVGVPVVAYDQYISGGKLASYVTSDNHQAGYLGGEYLASRFTPQQTIRLIVVEYPRVSSTVERLNGFLDALRDNGQPYRIVKTYEAVEPVAGRLVGEAILRDFPGKGSVDAIFTVNDGGGLGVVDVLAQAGRMEIQVASIDGDPQSVENIRKHRLTRIDSAQFCGPLGAEAMKAAYAIARGISVPRQLLVPTFPITAETLAHYPGWSGPIPAAFKKPWRARDAEWSGVVKAVK